MIHGVGADTLGQLSAFEGGRMLCSNMELHRAQVAQILFTDIDMVRLLEVVCWFVLTYGGGWGAQWLPRRCAALGCGVRGVLRGRHALQAPPAPPPTPPYSNCSPLLLMCHLHPSLISPQGDSPESFYSGGPPRSGPNTGAFTAYWNIRRWGFRAQLWLARFGWRAVTGPLWPVLLPMA